MMKVQFVRRALSFFLLLAIGLFAPIASAAEPLLIHVDAGNPPFMFGADERGTPLGMYPAILYSAFKRGGTPVVVKAIPWKRALLEIELGAAGVGGIYKNDERAAKFDYSDPIFLERIAVFYNTNNPIEFNSIRDLFGKRVGVTRGWSYGDDFDLAIKYDQVTAESTGGDQQNFSKLALGRIDAVLAIVESGERLLEKGTKEYADIRMAKTLLVSNQAYLAFAKKANQLPSIALFNKELAKMKKDGSFNALVQQELSR